MGPAEEGWRCLDVEETGPVDHGGFQHVAADDHDREHEGSRAPARRVSRRLRRRPRLAPRCFRERSDERREHLAILARDMDGEELLHAPIELAILRLDIIELTAA